MEEAVRAAQVLLTGYRIEQFVRRLVLLIAALLKLQRQAQGQVLAAAPEQEALVVSPSDYAWLSPDKQWIAVLDLPPEVREPRTTLPVVLRKVIYAAGTLIPAEPAEQFVGRRIWLANVGATIGPGARAEFPLEELQRALTETSSPAVLKVEGDAGAETWEPSAFLKDARE